MALLGAGQRLFGMQRHAVALAVDDDGAPAVRRDRYLGLDDLASVGFGGGDRLVETTVGIQVEKRTVRGGLVGRILYETAAGIAVAVGQNADRPAGDLRLMNAAAEDGGVELYRPIEVSYRDVHPDDLIGHIRSLGDYLVTAPSEAEETSLAYFAMTPVL